MPAFTRRTLLWKYAAYCAGLVSVLLAISGLVGGYFAYRESLGAVGQLQQATARYAALEIANYMSDVQQALRASLFKFSTAAAPDTNDLQIELISLLRHHPEVSEVRWIGADGNERFALSRLASSGVSSRNWSEDPRFLRARGGASHVGKVYFRDESEPYVSISVARDSTSSVLAAEVNLTHIWDVVAQAQLNPDAVAFVVDSQGQLVSHPDIGLVLAKTDLSALPHVRSALEHPAQGAALISEARDMSGQRVVSTWVSIPSLGWTVFAEEPVEQALRPVYDSITRSAALIALGVVAAIATSVLLARRMVRPIREIESRARLLGEGDFSQRMELGTGDELQAMATQFNRMAARLQDSHDKQELRIAERTRELAIANEGKSRFLAAASHDLRQPLHALALFTGELRSIKLPSDAAALAERIERSTESLEALLEALLDLSKLDLARVTADPEPVALQDLLARVVGQFAASAEAKGLALRQVHTSLWVRSDPMLLERIVQNLLANAVRYTEKGRIVLGCRRRGDKVDVLIADTGVGIDPQHLPHVFEEFYRAAKPDRGMGAGLGLGLAIVKRLAALLDHDVQVGSTMGRGTVVRLALPRVPAQELAIAPGPATLDTLRGVRVLVVDDEPFVREAVQGLLKRWGCEVSTAANGQEALASARARRPDVILCDLDLQGGESGIEVADGIRRQCGASVPCAFVTGESSPELIAKARATGQPILFKPTTPAKLRALVEHLADPDRIQRSSAVS